MIAEVQKLITITIDKNSEKELYEKINKDESWIYTGTEWVCGKCKYITYYKRFKYRQDDLTDLSQIRT